METKSGMDIKNNKIIYLYMCLYKICDCDWFPLCLFVMQLECSHVRQGAQLQLSECNFTE